MAVAPIVQWENFLSVRPSIVCCRTWQAGPEAKQAGSKAWQAGPKAWQDGPEVWLAGPLAWLAGPEVWLAGPEDGRIISPSFRTSSPIGAAAQKDKGINKTVYTQIQAACF